MELTIKIEDIAVYDRVLRYLKRQPKVVIQQDAVLKSLLERIDSDKKAGIPIRFNETEFELYNKYLAN